MATDKYERECWAAGRLLCGIDEAGFGNLFGSLYIAGTVFPKDFDFNLIPGLNDSKLIKDEKRFALEILIKQYALWWWCEEITPATIDVETGYYAKYRVSAEVINSDKNTFDNLHIFMDGNVKIDKVKDCFINDCLVKGDSLVKTISASSILAKCAQRRQIMELGPQYPEYKVEKTNGYWSKDQVEAIVKFGPTKWHRLSYLKNIQWQKN